jgi:zinc/manganese transport system substrate-binding protein
MLKYCVLVPVICLLLLGSVACQAKSGTPNVSGGVIQVVAAENFWGSIASQVGGSHVNVTSIITNPNADPHSYEPTSQDARTVADAQYVIENGAGYDAWMADLISANPSTTRVVLDVGDVFGVPDGGNPHMWYNPSYVMAIVNKMSVDFSAIDPEDASYFAQSAQQYLNVGLQQYNSLIADIKAKYSGTPVGATESIFAYMAPALGLDLITPASYMNAVSEGTDISAADEATVEQQIDQKQIKVLVYNSQNTPPNVLTLLGLAKAQGIPTVTITETLEPATDTFQDWQSAQLQALENALALATGK